MDSSTWPPGSSSRRLLALTGLMVLVPIIWLVMLQTGYVLAYQACADRSNAWLHVPNAVFAAASVIALLLTWRSLMRVKSQGETISFLGWLAFLIAILFQLVVIASLIAPAILKPCD